MSWVGVVWGIAAGACLMLGAVHLLAWCMDRSRRTNLFFVAAAFSVGTFALIELGLMHAASPAQFLMLHRWGNVAAWLAIVGMVGFVCGYFGTGRAWLAWTVVGLRTVVLVMTFVPGPTFQYRAVTALTPVEFLGAEVVAPRGVPSPWVRLSELSTLLTAVFIVDAAVRLARNGDPRLRRRALVVGGGAALFLLAGAADSFLIHAGYLRVPYSIGLAFSLFLAAMGYELSADMIRAAHMARELRDNAESMRLAADAAHLAHWRWDIPQDVIWSTAGGRDIYGIHPSEPIGFQRFLETLHVDDRQPVRAAVDAAMAGDGAFAESYRVVSPGGAARWIDAVGRIQFAHGKPVRMLGVSRDVTDQKQTQDRFRLTFEASPNGLVLTDIGGRILLANRRAEEMLGAGPGELCGESILAFIPGRLWERHVIDRGESPGAADPPAIDAAGEVTARRRDGGRFAAEIGIHVVASVEGQLVLGTLADVTARRQAEAEARRLREQLTHVRRVATLGELSGALAHELNHPLAIILSNAQAAQRYLLQVPPNLAMVNDILADIVAEDLRASEVIRRLRALLRHGEVAAAPMSLNRAIEQVLELVRRDFVGRELVVIQRLAPDLPEIEGDRIQIQQAILNLVINAADAMADLPAGNRRIGITTRHHDGRVRVTVKDGGCGLPADTATLFEPFFTTKPQGLGMGLAVCRSIVEAHGGRVLAEPNPGEAGASFHIELPVSQVDPT